MAASRVGAALGFALHNNEIVHGSSSDTELSFSAIEDGESLLDSTVLDLSLLTSLSLS